MVVPCKLGLQLVFVHLLVARPKIEMPSITKATAVLTIVARHHVTHNHVGRIAEETVPVLGPQAQRLGRHSHH